MPPIKSKYNLNAVLVVLYVVAVLLLAVIGIIALQVASQPKSTGGTFGSVDTATYQAVFLSNGQVYFGKITNVSTAYLVLDDIYYLRVQQELQPTPEETEAGVTTTTDDGESKVVLVQLGNELHKPESAMTINRDHVLFWENLQGDSPVISSIAEAAAKATE